MPPNVALNQIPFPISTHMGVVALEEQLHQMVCAGTLDLSTAQHDIATDWIVAYKKYFQTGRPLPVRSSSRAYFANRRTPQV
jgi:hypothetical protein